VYQKDFIQKHGILESTFSKLQKDFNAQLEHSDLNPWSLYSIEPFGENGDCYSPGFYGKQLEAFIMRELESTKL